MSLEALVQGTARDRNVYLLFCIWRAGLFCDISFVRLEFFRSSVGAPGRPRSFEFAPMARLRTQKSAATFPQLLIATRRAAPSLTPCHGRDQTRGARQERALKRAACNVKKKAKIEKSIAKPLRPRGRAARGDRGRTGAAPRAGLRRRPWRASSPRWRSPRRPAPSNGVRDGDETDVDCGGSACGPCEKGDRCTDRDDCESLYDCIGERCTLPPTREPSRADGPAGR